MFSSALQKAVCHNFSCTRGTSRLPLNEHSTPEARPRPAAKVARAVLALVARPQVTGLNTLPLEYLFALQNFLKGLVTSGKPLCSLHLLSVRCRRELLQGQGLWVGAEGPVSFFVSRPTPPSCISRWFLAAQSSSGTVDPRLLFPLQHVGIYLWVLYACGAHRSIACRIPTRVSETVKPRMVRAQASDGHGKRFGVPMLSAGLRPACGWLEV